MLNFIYFKPEFLSTCTAMAVQVVPIPTALQKLDRLIDKPILSRSSHRIIKH